MQGFGKTRCYYCGEEIDAGSRRCQYCGSLLKTAVEDSGAGSRLDFDSQYNMPACTSEQFGQQVETGINIENQTGYVQQGGSAQGKTMTFNSQASYAPWPQTVNTTSSFNYNYCSPYKPGKVRKSLSNAMKVILTIICTFLPGIGQLIGLIAGIAFMNSENDEDRKSFGLVLLITSIIFFLLTFMIFIVIVAAVTQKQY